MDSKHVPSHVQSAIDSEQGKGRPLDDSTRDHIEGRLAGSLADMRVHTDPSAARLARAVSARAFAVGDDVFFAPGEYRPGSSAGDALIAHEAAHTIQHRGAPTSGPLAVSAPGDAFERDASAIAASGLGSRSLRHAPSARLLSRKPAMFPVRVGGKGTNVWFDWDATWEDASRTGSQTFWWGATPGRYDKTVHREVADRRGVDRTKLRVWARSTGTLLITVRAHFHVDVPGDTDQDYQQTCTLSCSVAIDKDGKIQFGAAAVPYPANTQENAWLELIGTNGVAQADSGEVLLQTTYGASQHTSSEGTSDTVGTSSGGSFHGVEFSVESSHTASSETGRADPAPTGQQAFVVTIDAARPDPKGTVEIDPNSVRAFMNKTFEVDFKRKDNAALPHAERDRLLAWYFGLSRLTRRRLKRRGAQKLRLEAWASPTGRAEYNQRLAERREAAVIETLGRFVDPENWEATPYGEDLLPQDDPKKEKEDPTMWSVTLKVVDEVTPDTEGFDDTATFKELTPD